MSLWAKLFGGGSIHTSDSPKQIQENIATGKAIMLDVRSQKERDAGFLKDSIFITIDQIKELPAGTKKLDGLPSDKIVYCH
jgi:predicted sulfurtransferase